MSTHDTSLPWDEFRGYDPTLAEPYSADRVYTKLGCSMHEAVSVRNGVTKSPSKVNPWMDSLLSHIVGDHPFLWANKSEFIRDCIYHRLHHIQTSEMLNGDMAIEVRMAMRSAEAYEEIARHQMFQEHQEDFEQAWSNSRNSPFVRESLRKAILAYAQDCTDPHYAQKARDIIA